MLMMVLLLLFISVTLKSSMMGITFTPQVNATVPRGITYTPQVNVTVPRGITYTPKVNVTVPRVQISANFMIFSTPCIGQLEM